MVNYERQISDPVTLLQEHLLVEGLNLIQCPDGLGRDGKRRSKRLGGRGVEVLGTAEDPQAVARRHGARVLMKEHAVRLEMDYAAGLQEGAVPLEEKRRRKPAVLAAELGVRESQPDLRNLSGSEVCSDELYPRTEESDIAQMVFGGIFGAFPQTGALDVHPDVIARWIALGKVYRVLPFPTAEFQHYGARCIEHPLVPMPLDLVVPEIEEPVGQHLCGRRLQKALERLVLCEFPEFTVSHPKCFSCR